MKKLAIAFIVMAMSATAFSKEVVVAAEFNGGPFAEMVKGFTAETGIAVKFVKPDNQSLSDFIPQSKADVVLTSVGEDLEEAKRAGQLKKMTAKIDTSLISPRFRDPDGYWIGYAYRVRSVFFNPNRVNVNDVPSYEQLSDAKWLGKLCTRSMDHKYNHAFVAWYLIHHGEEETRMWLEGIYSNSIKPIEGYDKIQAQKLAEGKCDIAVANSYYLYEVLEMPKYRIAAANNLAIKLPNQKTGAFPLVNSVAILKQAQNTKEANQFIEYLESYQSQRWFADALTMYPVRNDVKYIGFLKEYGESAGVEVPNIEQTSIARITDKIEKAKQLIKEAGFKK